MPPKRVQVEKAYDEPFIIVRNADVLELMQRVKPTSVCVYLVLMTHANRKAGNSCYPSTGTIAREANVSRRTVVSAVQELEDAGALVVEHRIDPEFGQTSSLYWLHRMRCADFAQGCEESEPPGGTKLSHPPMQDLRTNHMKSEPDEGELDVPTGPEQQPARSKSKARTSVPEDFDPYSDPKLAEWIDKNDFGDVVAEEVPKFIANHEARGSEMKDWSAAFRYWLTNGRSKGWIGNKTNVTPFKNSQQSNNGYSSSELIRRGLEGMNR